MIGPIKLNNFAPAVMASAAPQTRFISTETQTGFFRRAAGLAVLVAGLSACSSRRIRNPLPEFPTVEICGNKVHQFAIDEDRHPHFSFDGQVGDTVRFVWMGEGGRWPEGSELMIGNRRLSLEDETHILQAPPPQNNCDTGALMEPDPRVLQHTFGPNDFSTVFGSVYGYPGFGTHKTGRFSRASTLRVVLDNDILTEAEIYIFDTQE